MNRILRQLIIRTRRTVWAIIVAYMLGLHNFYKGEDKTPDNIVAAIEVSDVREDGLSKVENGDWIFPGLGK